MLSSVQTSIAWNYLFIMAGVGIAALFVLLLVKKILQIHPDAVQKRKEAQQKKEMQEYKASHYYKATKNQYGEVVNDLGLYGEYQIYRQMQQYASNGAKFLFNLYIPKDEGTTEIDVLMIHPSGIFVIESKNFSGVITGDEEEKKWFQTIKTKGKTETIEFYNPIRQNNKHVKYLRRITGSNINIHPIVCFSDHCQLKITHKKVMPVVHRRQLPGAIKNILKKRYTPMGHTKITELYKLLQQYTRVPESVKEEHKKGVIK